jgi:type 1 fimbria pilin
MKATHSLLLLLWTLAAPACARAASACTAAASAEPRDTYFVSIRPPSRLDFTLPLGSVLYSSDAVATVINYFTMSCTGGAGNVRIDDWYSRPSGPYSTLDSGVKGVGVRLSFAGASYWPTIKSYGAVNPINLMTSKTRVELVKTEETSPGGALIDQLFVFRRTVDPDPEDRIGEIFIDMTGAIERTMPVCTVTPPPAVELGSFTEIEFSGTGHKTPPVPFDVRLDCEGLGSADVFLTISDPITPSNRSDRIASTAEGVAIQIFHDDKAIRFGPDSSTAGTANQFGVGSTDAGTFVIPFKAAYLQTAPSIKAGPANGGAAFTMSYQ